MPTGKRREASWHSDASQWSSLGHRTAHRLVWSVVVVVGPWSREVPTVSPLTSCRSTDELRPTNRRDRLGIAGYRLAHAVVWAAALSGGEVVGLWSLFNHTGPLDTSVMLRGYSAHNCSTTNTPCTLEQRFMALITALTGEGI